MESTTRAVAFVAPDRGECSECSASVLLRNLDGYVRQHDGCPGGGRPPVRVKPTEDVPLPEPT